MIDWPNAMVGFLLGVLVTLAFWLVDHQRAKRQRRRDALDGWKGAAKEIELLLGSAETTAATLYTTRVKYPIDTWRAVLGPEDFRILERLERAYQAMEYPALTVAEPGQFVANAERFKRAEQERRDAITSFANLSRRMQSEGYHEVVTAEQRRETRRNLLRHPVRTLRQLRHNRKIHRDAGLSS